MSILSGIIEQSHFKEVVMPMVAESFKLIRQSEAVVKEALNLGVVDQILGTHLSVADGYVLCSMKDVFLEEWLSHFPDPRQEK